MTRGRKKDLTIPPTRSLTQQRDYRARKANYVNELEARCRKAEEENVQLRRELAETKARLANPVVVLPETAQASKELLQNLALASVSLTKFQQLAFPDAQQADQHSIHGNLNSHETQVPPRLTHNGDAPMAGFVPQNHPRIGRKRLFTESEDDTPFSPSLHTVSTPAEWGRSESSEESCCGGYVDCDALGSDGILEQKEGTRDKFSRVSGMRSTSDCRHETP